MSGEKNIFDFSLCVLGTAKEIAHLTYFPETFTTTHTHANVLMPMSYMVFSRAVGKSENSGGGASIIWWA